MFPNWLRVILLVLTFASFLPQIRRIWVRRDASGISLRYVLFNLIAASEQFAVNFVYAYLYTPGYGEEPFVHDPMTDGDWLNLAQTTLFMLLFVVYFSLYLWFPSDNKAQHKKYALGIYVAYCLAAILPLFIAAIIQSVNNDSPTSRGSHSITDSHLNSMVAVLALLGTYYQVEKLPTPPSPDTLPLASSSCSASYHCGSLSISGLAIQALLFSVLTVSWLFRVPHSPSPDVDWWYQYRLESWYEGARAVAVDNAAFAVGQGFLFCVVMHRRWFGGDVVAGQREREPLLRSDGD